MITVKLFFGISYLSMPNTFLQAGLVGGIILFTLVIFLNGVTMIQLLMISDELHGIKNYSQLSFKLLGHRGKQFVDICIFVKQISSAVAY